jgi:hypothetical protein
MIIGFWRDFRYSFPDRHFAAYARALNSAPSGAIVTIPETPEGWNVNLIKH